MFVRHVFALKWTLSKHEEVGVGHGCSVVQRRRKLHPFGDVKPFC